MAPLSWLSGGHDRRIARTDRRSNERVMPDPALTGGRIAADLGT
jgi:hypothetical protein